MKKIKIIIICLLAVSTTLFNSCTDAIDDLVTGDVVTGGLLDVQSPLLTYVIGEQDGYNINVKVLQGAVKTNQIKVFKSFTNSVGETSNSTLLKTVDISDQSTSILSFTVGFSELIEGLTLNGSPISSNDTEYAIGDFWELSYVSSTSEGNESVNRQTTKVAVSGKYAGVYTVVESAYVHPTAGNLGGWNGSTMVIESVVDAFTYHILGNGPFTTDQNEDNEFYFIVNDDNSITIPKEWNGELQTVWGADEVANCTDNPNELPDVCYDTNVVGSTDDELNVTISHGYIRDSGTRQFRYKLVKN